MNSNTRYSMTEIAYKYNLSLAYKIRDLARYYAPVKTGYMRDNIDVVEDKENGVIAVVSFAEYSIWPHECMYYRHKEPGQAKFLEQAAIDVYNRFNGLFDFRIQYRPQLCVYITGYDGGKSIKTLLKEYEYLYSNLRTYMDGMINKWN